MSTISLNAINRRINDTKAQIESLEKQEECLIIRFQKQELYRRLDILLKEKEAMLEASSKEQVRLRLYGENVDAGKIQNRILVSVLGGFQEMLDNIANTMVGANSSRGSVTEEAKHISDFQVCGIFAGSFGIVLEKDYEQLELTSESYETERVLDELFTILEYSESGTDLVGKIAPYGQRTVRHFRDWLNQMKENLINVEVDWRNEQAEIRKMDIKYYNASKIIGTLDSMGEIRDEDIQLIDAMITGVNIRKFTFELTTNDNQIIKGKSRPETLIKASTKFGSKSNVKVTKSVCELYTGALKESWFLLDVD